jgi:peroxiredoxin
MNLDSVEPQKKCITTFRSTFPPISDKKKQIARACGVLGDTRAFANR